MIIQVVMIIDLIFMDSHIDFFLSPLSTSPPVPYWLNIDNPSMALLISNHHILNRFCELLVDNVRYHLFCILFIIILLFFFNLSIFIIYVYILTLGMTRPLNHHHLHIFSILWNTRVILIKNKLLTLKCYHIKNKICQTNGEIANIKNTMTINTNRSDKYESKSRKDGKTGKTRITISNEICFENVNNFWNWKGANDHLNFIMIILITTHISTRMMNCTRISFH